MRKALFPISLSDQGFGMEPVASALRSLLPRYDRIVVPVSDHARLYALALRGPRGGGIGPTLCGYYETQDYLARRDMWVRRLMARIGKAGEGQRWEIVGVETLSDGITFQIFRNVMLAFYQEESFRQDVLRSAERVSFAADEGYPLQSRVMLSQGHVLEEIALSLRLHAFEEIYDGYYLSGLPEVILNLYRGAYVFGVHDLAETPQRNQAFHFYRKTPGSSPVGWVLHPCPRRDAARASGEVPLRVISS